MDRIRPTREDGGSVFVRFGQDTTILMTCGGLEDGGGLKMRLKARISFRLSGGGASTFSAGVAVTRSGLRVSCVHREMNA